MAPLVQQVLKPFPVVSVRVSSTNMDLIGAARQLGKGGAEAHVLDQLRVASSLVDAMSERGAHGAAASPRGTEQIVLNHLRERVLGWIAAMVRSGTLTSSLFEEGQGQDAEGHSPSEQLDLFWKMVHFLVCRSDDGAASSGTHAASTHVSPALAASLCTLMCRTVERAHIRPSTLKSISKVFLNGFGLDDQGNRLRKARSIFSLPPEQYIRFIIRMIQGLQPRCEESPVARDSVLLTLSGMQSWVAAQTNERKVYKLTVSHLLVPLLRMSHSYSTKQDDKKAAKSRLQKSNALWTAKCTKQINVVLRQALFSVVLGSMKRPFKLPSK